jgi:2-keto-4-pentenoate hydratase
MIERLAASLRDAHSACRPIPPIRQDVSDPSAELAYRIQWENVRHRTAAGQSAVGWKIGLTSRAVQRQLGVEQPDYGVLFENMETPDGGLIDLASLIQAKIEAEIAFVLGRDLDRPVVTLRDVLAATEYVLPCLEICDSRIRDWDISLFDTIADNASSARFVLGSTPCRLPDFDFIHCGMVLREDGAALATGAGAASLGNPVEAVRWLAERAAASDRPLQVGDVVLSGALGPMVPVRAGCHYSAYIAGLGSVTTNFAGASA